jgi:hypothetical protein
MITKRFTSTFALALGLASISSVALAESTVTTTEKTTSYSGVVSNLDAGASTIVFKSETATPPVVYNYTKETVFVDGQGKVVSQETIRNSPVTIDYIKEGDRSIVRRVVVTTPEAGTRVKETTTKTETH